MVTVRGAPQTAIAQDRLCIACPTFAGLVQQRVAVVAQLLRVMEHPTHAELVHLRASVLHPGLPVP